MIFSFKQKILISSLAVFLVCLSTTSTHAATEQQASTGGLYSAIGGTATCSAGQVLGRLISSAVGQAIGGITNSVVDSIVDEAKNMNKVPVFDSDVKKETAAGAQNTQKLVAKSVGGGNPGGSGIISGIVNGIQSVSWDSIMYCIVNEILTYITQSTIQWINSGFNGNPVFIQNMGTVLQRIGSREASNFTREISYGAQQAAGQAADRVVNGVKTKVYRVATPFRKGVIDAIAGTQDDYQGLPPLSPTLSQNYNSFTSGNYMAGGGLAGLAELSYNNPYIARQDAIQTYQQRVAQAQQIQESQIVNGTQSFYKCKPGMEVNGYCSPKDRIVTTPAQDINTQTGQVSGMKYLRLSFAKDFDSVVTALVNQLVKIAINKIYESVQN